MIGVDWVLVVYLVLVALSSGVVGLLLGMITPLGKRRRTDAELEQTVDDLVSSVERLVRQQRREQMRAVRAAASPDPGSPPPQLRDPGAPVAVDVPSADRKAALRARLRGLQ